LVGKRRVARSFVALAVRAAKLFLFSVSTATRRRWEGLPISAK